jgi:hypothetical protein
VPLVVRRLTGRLSATTVQLCLLVLFTMDGAVAQSQKKGDASLRIEYQYIHNGNYVTAEADYDYWTTDSHVALLSGDYALSDRLTIYAALPYVQKRFNPDPDNPFGGDPHNPNDPWWIDFVPPDKRFIDDGTFHGGLQDLSVGLRYLALDGPLSISPYIGYGFPADDYPFYAKAAIGQNLWNLPVGVLLDYVPYFSDWFFRGSLAYVFSEKPLDVNVDYWLGYLSAGYWFKPQFAVNVFLSSKYIRNGYVLPWSYTDDPTYGNFPEDFDTIEWWQHDRLIRHRFVNAGIAFDYFVNSKYKLSGSYFTGIWADQTNEVDRAFTIALTRYWGDDKTIDID